MAEPLLEAAGIVKRFGTVEALRGASFTVFPAEIVALIGDNGAGKSTLVKALSGIQSFDAGEVRFEGRPVSIPSPIAARELGIETVYQDLALAPELDPTANLFLGREITRSGPLGFFGFLDKGAMRKRTDEAFDSLGVRIRDRDATVGTLSGGQRQGCRGRTGGHLGEQGRVHGRAAAKTLQDLLEGKDGSVLVVNVKPGISTTDERQKGFEEGIKATPNLKYLGGEYSNNEPAKAASIVTSTVSAEKDLVGIFATNLFAAEGSATGLRESGKKEVRVVGFDAGPAQVKQLEEGLVQALIAQKPAEIGKLGVEQAIASLEGGAVKKEIVTGTEVITKDNLEQPVAQEALYKAEC